MSYPELLRVTIDKLIEMGHADKAKFIKYAVVYGELHSCLREYFFHRDALVDDFLRTMTATGVVNRLLK